MTAGRGSLLFPLPDAKRANATGAARPTRADAGDPAEANASDAHSPLEGPAKAIGLSREGDVCPGTQLFENKGGP